MAKAKPIKGLKPHAPTGTNAREIARTRLEEMYKWEQYVDEPYSVQELHNLRIAAKRVRYTLEIFEDVLPKASTSLVDELTKIQDELGALHDSDVMIALLRLCLGSSDGGAMYEQALTKTGSHQPKGHVIVPPELVADVVDPKVAPSAEERYGLEQLLMRRHQQREEEYQAFHQHWQQLEEQHFHQKVLDVLNDETTLDTTGK